MLPLPLLLSLLHAFFNLNKIKSKFRKPKTKMLLAQSFGNVSVTFENR
jgi:hypothetical protein